MTLDGHKYTFNGKGEFTLIKTTNNRFTLQGRMEPALDSDGNQAPGTVFTAIVAKEETTNTTVQFEIRENSFMVLHTSVNSQSVEFDEFAVQEFGNVTLIDKGNDTISAYFSGGVYVEIKAENAIISVLLVSLPDSMKGTTRGLMGSFNGIRFDDLVPKLGSQPLPLDSSIEDIHSLFGLTCE